MWTAWNELDARWDYIRSWDMMWINKTEVPVEQQMVYPDFVPRKPAHLKHTLDLDLI